MNRERLVEIWRMTWPQVLMLVCQIVIGLTDVWAAGRIGPQVQASIGLTTQCQTFLMTLAFAASSGAVAAVSQSLGAGRVDRARRYVGLVLFGGGAVGLLLTLVGLVFQVPFLRLVQTPEAIMPTALLFLQISLWSLPSQYVLNIGAAVFRAAKSVLRPLYVTGMVCLCNVFGDLAFGLGWWGFPAYGATGIAWSTLLSITFGALVMIGLLARDGLCTRKSWLRWRWVRSGGPYLAKVAGPALGTSAFWQTGYLVLFIITASLPYNSVDALAGLTAGLRIEAFIFMPGVAFGMTASVLVGHALGAGKVQEARRVVFTVLGIGCGCMSVVGMVLWPLRHALAAFLAPDLNVQVETANYLFFNLLSVPFTVTSVVLAGALNGAGATVYPMTAFSTSIWCVRLPLAWWLGHHLWGNASGVFAAMLISQMVQASALFWITLRCDWTRFAMRRAS